MSPAPFGAIGTRPAEMSIDDWARLCRAYGPRPQCQCLIDGNCLKPCAPIGSSGTYKLDCDRIIPGGAYKADNCVFRCAHGGANANRNRQNRPDPEWRQTFFFDDAVDIGKLRPSQRYGSWQSVVENAGVFLDPPPVLFTRLLLYAAFTGAGKVAAGLGLLAAINHVRLSKSPYARRIRRVLWLTNQRALAFQLAHELVVDYAPPSGKNPGGCGLLRRPPRVEVVVAENWERSLSNHEICCAVPQALWDRKDAKRSDDDIRSILSQFDAIIADECDFATAALDRLIQLSPLFSVHTSWSVSTAANVRG
jgi:hypothetical protein